MPLLGQYLVVGVNNVTTGGPGKGGARLPEGGTGHPPRRRSAVACFARKNITPAVPEPR